MTDKIIVHVNCSSLTEATAIARALIAKRLVACANVGTHMQSIYIWKGQVEEGTEYPLTLKTRLDRMPEIEAEVTRLHSYKTPEIIALPILGGSESYLQWIDASLS